MTFYDRDFSFAPTAIQPVVPTPPKHPPRPLGELSEASAEEIVALVCRKFGTTPRKEKYLRSSLLPLLVSLSRFPGGTQAGRLNTAEGYAFAIRLIQPSLLAFRSYNFLHYTDIFREAAQDRLLDEFFEPSNARSMAQKSHRQSRFDICAALTVYGIELADLTPEGLLHYATESRKHGVTLGEHPADGCFAGTKCWPVLVDMGHFPESAPRSMRSAVVRGQRSVDELVDRHEIRNQTSAICSSTTSPAAGQRSTTPRSRRWCTTW
ncbi:hypothetical protein [Streptomyces sp. NPDC006368]|uniref:hypothetical protein n=1 Tax=Streptomyces sp. NPDC006368 TaxID=3156760 RepID=UPI0033B2ECA4